MSNRYNRSRQDGNKGFVKTQRKFVPKSNTSNPKESNPNPTLSTSIRQLYSTKQSSEASTGSGGASSVLTSRVRMGESGEWVSSRAQGGNFVNYLPQDEAVATGLGAEEGGLDALESQRVVDLLNRELSRLLKLKPREFWREVARDTSLHEFLDSFLQFRSRWYDFPHHGAKGIVAGVIVGELDLSRRVFMILYRISSNKDPGARSADSLSLKDHEVLLQEKRLLDLPKLLDICAIYGHENEELTRMLVSNALKAQHWIHDNLTAVISHVLGIVHTMQERCSSSLEVLISSGKLSDHDSSGLQTDLLGVMDFINDAIESMDAFINAYKPAAVFFACPIEMSYGNEELLGTLVRLHDSLLPSLHQGFRTIFASREDGMVSNIVTSLKMLSMRLVKLGWRLLDFCYLSDEIFRDSIPLPLATKMFPANVEDPVIRGDILVQTFRELSAISHVQENHQKETFLQNVERNFSTLSRVENLCDSGWIFIDEENSQYISGIMMCSPKEPYKEPHSVSTPSVGKPLQMDENSAILESRISQIKDLFPDYGKGFLAACLEVYDQNPEEVIQRILEGTLHEDLQCLNSSLETIPAPPTLISNDKGKGKLVDSTLPPSNNAVAVSREQHTEGPLLSSSSSLGKYVRKSKSDLPHSSILDRKDEKQSARTAALVSQYEYEDEYDDSFDDLGLSVADSGVEENDLLADKMSTKLGKSWQTDTGNSFQVSSNSKWGSRKKPQYYVKDGKNYSYKVAGAIAVANDGEASLVSQAQQELIHGLGRGGNIPLGAVKKLTEYHEEEENQINLPAMEGLGILGNPRGRGRRGGGRPREYHEQQGKQSDVSEVEGRGNMTNYRGKGSRGGGRPREYYDEQQEKQSDVSEVEGRGNMTNYRGKGSRGGGRPREYYDEQQEKQSDVSDVSEVEGRGNMTNKQGRGRRGGGRSNNYRKDQAMKKHFSGLGGY
ncbi:Activating signal cointegrator 1 complex subunit 2 [Quillaja saponaria]|uniref:Activating signal cointegrator 1 complex subunit 2 n=1 Tax=Quillaja saponaria TaxID=32244 RepID=A0AAD7LHE8_QUISA|nr:Activating signal cointegrator 1 complex subunit 2 [Quillaja saponaria]